MKQIVKCSICKFKREIIRHNNSDLTAKFYCEKCHKQVRPKV